MTDREVFIDSVIKELRGATSASYIKVEIERDFGGDCFPTRTFIFEEESIAEAEREITKAKEMLAKREATLANLRSKK